MILIALDDDVDFLKPQESLDIDGLEMLSCVFLGFPCLNVKLDFLKSIKNIICFLTELFRDPLDVGQHFISSPFRSSKCIGVSIDKNIFVDNYSKLER